MLTISFLERLSGAYRAAHDSARDRPLLLDVQARGRPWALRFDAVGHMSIEGLATRAPTEGTIALLSRDSGAIAYDFQFCSDAGARLRLVADKRHLATDAYANFTTLTGTLRDVARGVELGSMVARFDARGDVAWWLTHIRFSLSPAEPAT